jgi:hypothetical protein
MVGVSFGPRWHARSLMACDPSRSGQMIPSPQDRGTVKCIGAGNTRGGTMESDEQPRAIRQVCGQCNGAGVVDIRGKGASSTPGDYAKRCPTCEGTGWVLGATRA